MVVNISTWAVVATLLLALASTNALEVTTVSAPVEHFTHIMLNGSHLVLIDDGNYVIINPPFIGSRGVIIRVIDGAVNVLKSSQDHRVYELDEMVLKGTSLLKVSYDKFYQMYLNPALLGPHDQYYAVKYYFEYGRPAEILTRHNIGVELMDLIIKPEPVVIAEDGTYSREFMRFDGLLVRQLVASGFQLEVILHDRTVLYRPFKHLEPLEIEMHRVLTKEATMRLTSLLLERKLRESEQAKHQIVEQLEKTKRTQLSRIMDAARTQIRELARVVASDGVIKTGST